MSERLTIEARQRLRSRDRSVRNVARYPRISSPLNFSRFFKRHIRAAATEVIRLSALGSF